MGATTMAKITLLLKKLEHRLPLVEFRTGNTFAWDYTAPSITYDATSPLVDAYLLHEAGHALLNHQEYTTSIQLLELERDAWQKAEDLSKELGVTFPKEIIDDALDSYRDWLHARTICPTCQATGIEVARNRYTCLACQHAWTTNDARSCALRRYKK